jgi:hypothetical protein
VIRPITRRTTRLTEFSAAGLEAVGNHVRHRGLRRRRLPGRAVTAPTANQPTMAHRPIRPWLLPGEEDRPTPCGTARRYSFRAHGGLSIERTFLANADARPSPSRGAAVIEHVELWAASAASGWHLA